MSLVLALDASNISSGGGLTHLNQLLSAASPAGSGISRVHIWASRDTGQKLPQRDWLIVHTPDWCNAGLMRRLCAQQWVLPGMIKRAACDVLFSPGGTLPAYSFIPMVTMSQNMLPFEPERALLFGRWSWMRQKMRLLRFSQGRSFGYAQGVIFLTHYAHKVISDLVGLQCASAVIPHGIESRFVMTPRPKRYTPISTDQPLRLLYVSIQMPYKHHLEVMSAIAQLRKQGLAVTLDMVGDNPGAYGDAVRCKRMELDPYQTFLRDLGYVDFERLHHLYRQADAFIFASSCENLPNILIEAMAAGLPVACSSRGPMPEILGDAGIYFNPESVESIEKAIAQLADDADLRIDLAKRAWARAQGYSWERCAQETFDFVSKIALQCR